SPARSDLCHCDVTRQGQLLLFPVVRNPALFPAEIHFPEDTGAGAFAGPIAVLADGALHTMHTANLARLTILGLLLTLVAGLCAWQTPPAVVEDDRPPPRALNVEPKSIGTDPTVKYDYDIVYVRAPRKVKRADGKEYESGWAEIMHPVNVDAGYDLML